jgi:cytochrome P450
VSNELAPDVDPNIDDLIADPATYADEEAFHRAFTQLRRHDPMHWCEPRDYRPFWAVTRHADVMAVELNAKNFLNAPRQFLVTRADEEMLQAQTGSSNFARNLVAMDNPDHKAYRALTADWFTQKSMQALEAQIAGLAREAIDAMVARGSRCDFVKDVAAWFPLRIIMLVLGVPPEDEPLMLELSQKVFGNADPDTGGGEGMTSMLEAFSAFNRYFSGVTEDRRTAPRNDVASILANALIDGAPIGEAERNAYYLIVAAAGHDTTSSATSGGLLALLQHPDQMAKLRADPSLMPRAVDEMIRWTSPVKHFFRTAVSDCEVGGKQVRAGDSLMMCYWSANRDEDVFDAPFEFRVDRSPNRHLAFGYGAHICLGKFLAKLEMQVLFAELLARIDDIRLAGEPAWVKANFVSGLKTLPITFRA